MSTNNIENQICEAIEIIVNKAVSNAGYDKTIRATVLECVDQTIGKHKVKYQDSIFFAYTEGPGAIRKNTEVYVLIHNNDFSANKTILGSVDKLGSDYVDSSTSIEKRYEKIGTSIISNPNGEFGLCSYIESQDNSLYSDNEIALLPDDEINEYISQGSSLILEAEFKTALDQAQRVKGNYGILLDINFYKTEDKNENEIVTKNFVFDINNIVGEPYALAAWTPQYIAFEIENNKFKAIKDIRLFEYGFPNQAEGKPSDIFIKNISLFAANEVPEQQLTGNYLSIITPQGTIFTAENTDNKTMKAEVRAKGDVVDAKYQGLKYYWFRENASVTVGHDKYHKYAGDGWECLNEKEIIPATEDAPAVIEWISGTEVYTIEKDSLLSLENKFKCVVSYDGMILSREVTFKNKDAQYKLHIESSEGFIFYQNTSAPTLTCMVKDESKPDDYIYYWLSVDNNNIARKLEDTANDKEIYGIDDVKKNQLIGVQLANISKFTTYKCAVYEKDGENAGRYIGTTAATLSLQEKVEVQNTYSLVLNNANQLFKYNADGIAPNSSAVENPIELLPLSFTLYDSKGNEIPTENIPASSITWTIPTENTLIENAEPANNNTLLNYDLKNRYDINATENTIYLKVQYDGVTLRAQTNFFFVREGDAGTSGTEYTCVIVPNQTEEYTITYPQLFYNVETGEYSLNYERPAGQLEQWFKVQVWKDNEQIIEDTFTSGLDKEGKNYTVTWSILANKYGLNAQDKSNIIIDATTGRCSLISKDQYSFSNNIALLIRCEVVIKESPENKTLKLFGTLPLTVNNIFSSAYADVKIKLKEDSGFRSVRYASDGTSPIYTREEPFTIEIENKNIEECKFTWAAIGTINGVPSNDLQTNTDYINAEYKDIPWKCRFIPTQKYTGECVTNGVVCVVEDTTTNTTIGNIYIPVHMFLNTYGQAALNDWDGNTLQLNEDGGYILAPKIGAGEKNDSNQFTGMVMGQVRESGKTTIDNGLLGYVDGVRSFFLDAETGRAEFGKTGNSQIIIDPKEAFIKSGNYSTSKKTGLLIDLIKPEIRYGNGNFVVDEAGNLTATGADITGVIKATGGYIGGWYLSGGALVNDVNDTTITLSPQLGITVGDCFQVTPDGSIRLTGTIEWGEGSHPVSKVYAVYARDISELDTPNQTFDWYQKNGTDNTWHTEVSSLDYYISYNYDNGIATGWGKPIKIQGSDGKPGEKGETGDIGPRGPQGEPGSAANVPDYIQDTYIDGTRVESCEIYGAMIYATGKGAKHDVGGKDAAAYYIYNGIPGSGGILKGYLSFDNTGPASSTDEAHERVFLTAVGDSALKIGTENANLSIAAGGEDNYVYMGSRVNIGKELSFARKIGWGASTDEYKGTAKTGQVFFVIQ